MTTLILAFAILLAVVPAMSVAALVDHRVIKGSCGGLNKVMGGNARCEFCGGNGNNGSGEAAEPRQPPRHDQSRS